MTRSKAGTISSLSNSCLTMTSSATFRAFLTASFTEISVLHSKILSAYKCVSSSSVEVIFSKIINVILSKSIMKKLALFKLAAGIMD